MWIGYGQGGVQGDCGGPGKVPNRPIKIRSLVQDYMGHFRVLEHPVSQFSLLYFSENFSPAPLPLKKIHAHICEYM